MRTLHLLTLGLLLAVFVPAAASAQTEAATATVTVDDILEITVTGTTIDFGTVNATGYATTADQSVITHQSNVTHTLQISADAAFWDAVTPANDGVKPAADLEWSLDNTAFTGITTVAQDLHTSAAPGTFSNHETVDFRLKVEVDDVPDDYSLAFTYSVIAG